MSNNLVEPFIIKREDFCPNCKADRALQFLDLNNKIVDYTLVLDKCNIKEEIETKLLNIKQLKKLKCRYCQAEYIIDFSNNSIRPMMDEYFKIQKFMNNIFKRND